MQNNSLVLPLENICNALEMSGVILVLILSFCLQFIFHELPCPLCLLQRIGFFGIALGFLMNLRFGFRPSHYSVVLISALFTSFVSLRQIALHVEINTGSYGDAFLGFHLYTWSFILSMVILVATTLMLGVDRQYLSKASKPFSPRLVHALFAALMMIASLNMVAVISECGIKACPENPSHYLL